MLLYTTFCFEASHSLQAPIGVPSVHGHSYWARVWIASSREQLTPLPTLEAEAKRVAALLDHQHLNDLMDHQPTMEALVDYIRAQWRGPALQRVHVWRESLGCGVEWSAS